MFRGLGPNVKVLELQLLTGYFRIFTLSPNARYCAPGLYWGVLSVMVIALNCCFLVIWFLNGPL